MRSPTVLWFRLLFALFSCGPLTHSLSVPQIIWCHSKSLIFYLFAQAFAQNSLNKNICVIYRILIALFLSTHTAQSKSFQSWDSILLHLAAQLFEGDWGNRDEVFDNLWVENWFYFIVISNFYASLTPFFTEGPSFHTRKW